MKYFNDDGKVKVERREHPRHNIPAAVVCRFFNKNLRGESSFQGFIQDISFGGVSLEVRDDLLIINDSKLKYTNIEMALELNMPDGVHKMNITGVIRWQKRVKKENMNFLYLGIQFYNLQEREKTIIKKYLAIGTGEKNLIWNLWDNLSMQS